MDRRLGASSSSGSVQATIHSIIVSTGGNQWIEARLIDSIVFPTFFTPQENLRVVKEMRVSAVITHPARKISKLDIHYARQVCLSNSNRYCRIEKYDLQSHSIQPADSCQVAR